MSHLELEDAPKVKIGIYGGLGRDAFSANNGADWHTCREQFANVFTVGTLSIHYRVNKNGGHFPKVASTTDGLDVRENVARFLHECEDRVKWKRTKFSRVHGSSDAMYCQLQSDRWINGPDILRSLFTLLLRSGVNYAENISFDECLDLNVYSKQTRFAIDRFLDGFTIIKGTSNQWHQSFQQNTAAKKALKANKHKIKETAMFEWELAGKPEGEENSEVWLDLAKQRLKGA